MASTKPLCKIASARPSPTCCSTWKMYVYLFVSSRQQLMQEADQLMLHQRAETDFFSGEPLQALSTLVYSDNVDLQRSASLTFAEITERGVYYHELMTSSSLIV